MIRIIDNVRYLPKNKRNGLLGGNQTHNRIFKEKITRIKRKLSRINTNGKSATVTIFGNVKVGHNESIRISTECQDAELHEKITKTLH